MSKDLNEEYLKNLLSLLRGFEANTPITEDDINNVYLTIRDSYNGDQMFINKIAGDAYKTLSASEINSLKATKPSNLVKTILKFMYENYEKEINTQLSMVKSQFEYLLKGLEK